MASPDGDESNNSNINGEVETVSVPKPDPNEERTQVSTTTSLQPAKTITDSEPPVKSPGTDNVQETCDTAEVNAASTPIANTTTPSPDDDTEPSPGVATSSPVPLETPTPRGWDVVSRRGSSAASCEEGRTPTTHSKPVWMKQKKKRMSSGNKKRQRGGGCGGRGSKRPELPAPPPPACECDAASCCDLNTEWMRTGNVKFQLYETLKDMETEILHFKDLAVETRDRMPSENFPQSHDLLCLKVAEKMKKILPKMRKIFLDFDSGYITCMNCELGKMIFHKIIELKKHFENFETQLLSQGLYYFKCYVKEFVEPSEIQCESLCQKMLSNFQSEYAGWVLLYHGNPKAIFLKSLYAKLADYHEISLRNKKRTIFECIPSTICFSAILSLKHTMMDLKMCLGTDVKEMQSNKSVQMVTKTPPKDDPKCQLINSRRHLRRELFKPAPLPQSTAYNLEYLEGIASYAENKHKCSRAIEPKVEVAPNKSKPRVKQGKRENMSNKTTNIETIKSIPKENVARRSRARIPKELADKVESLRRDVERIARDRRPKSYRVRSDTRSISSPAVMITSNVKSMATCRECVSGGGMRRVKSKTYYTTDDLGRTTSFTNEHDKVGGVLNDSAKMLSQVITNLLDILLYEQGEGNLSMMTPQPNQGLTVNQDQSCTDETCYCCLEKIKLLRYLVNHFESTLSRSLLFLRISEYLDETPCSRTIIKRERPLVWPKHVKPARIVEMVEKLQNHFITHESQAQLSPYFRSDVNSNDLQNLVSEYDAGCHWHEDEDDQPSFDSSLNERSGDEDVNQRLGVDTKISTHIPQEIVSTQRNVDNKHTEKTVECKKTAEIKFVRDNDRDQNISNQAQIRQEPIGESQSPRSIKTSSKCSRNKEVAPSVRAGEPGHPLKTCSSKTDLIMSAVKKKMSSRVHSAAASVPDMVPAEFAGGCCPAPGGRGERTPGDGPHHHERSENTSCTLY